MHIHYGKISVKFHHSLHLLPWQLDLNRSSSCNLDPFFLKLCWNLAFPHSSTSFCSENETIPHTASSRVPMGLWAISVHCCCLLHKSGWLTVAVTGSTGSMASSSPLEELFLKVSIPPNSHWGTGVEVLTLFFRLCNWTLYYFCLYTSCTLSFRTDVQYVQE